MRKFSKKQVIVGGIAAAAIAVGGGAAFAYWTSGGTGSGSAKTGTSTGFTVTVDANTQADLSPNGPTDLVGYHILNTGSGTEYATSATPSVVDTSNPLCDASNFEIASNDFVAGPITSGSTANYNVGVKMFDTGLNQDACQGVTVNVKVVVA